MLLLRKNALKEWASPHAVNRKKTTDVLYISVDQQWQFCSLKIKHTKFHVSINIACIFTDFYLYFLSFKFKMLDLYFEQQHKHFGVFKSTLTILHSNFSNHPKYFFFKAKFMMGFYKEVCEMSRELALYKLIFLCFSCWVSVHHLQKTLVCLQHFP